ncbi:hypothetical protein TBLA_0B04370 [Henningerozyma blattae CBS 6284]|uniref:GYF domain-containing protein n=1 Tax=Henningerozyma blattae (strain ATCC 34711 / CBS 6284 / DSM 70876 / NBRC 10599 / NRRL Y-10934 / UCD 77-7) TaxID=1071380 RepID=I2GYS2_HENB6|nr:hypothetical protein TBLA_0B04370 [Tetrapisispora blattae CBS 6284]CCH59274.1 hypothetical protein TBLA_0B04370 [Tetrapisispora blattae CBS 6284]
MTFQSNFNDQFNSMNFQFQNLNTTNQSAANTRNIKLDNNATTNNTNTTAATTATSQISTPLNKQGQINITMPLSRTTSLLDSFGIPRTSSPFMSHTNLTSSNQNISNSLLASQNTTSTNTPTIPTSSLNWNGIDPLNNNTTNNTTNAIHQRKPNDIHPALSSPSLSALTTSSNSTVGITSQQQFNPMLIHPQTPLSTVPALPPLNLHPMVESQWKYFDTSSTLHGPFTTNTMGSWYVQGYFQPALQITRLNTSPEPFNINDQFITLAELISKVNDFQNPFLRFDNLVSLFIAQQQQSLQGTPAANPIPQQFQFPEIKTLDNSTNNKNALIPKQDVNEEKLPDGVVANIHSKDYIYEELLNLKFDDGGYYKQTTVRIPVSRLNKELLPDSFIFPKPKSPVSPTSPAPVQTMHKETKSSTPLNKEVSPITKKLENSTVKKETPIPLSEPEINPDALIGSFSKEEQKLELERKRQEKADEIARKLLEEQTIHEQELKKKEEAKKLKKLQKQKEKEKKEFEKKQKIVKQQEKEKEEQDKKKLQNEMKLKREKEKELQQEKKKQQQLAIDAERERKTMEFTEASIAEAPWANKANSRDDVVVPNIAEMIKSVKQDEAKKIKMKNTKDLNFALKAQSEILTFNNDSLQQQSTPALTWATKPTPQPINVDIKSKLNSPKASPTTTSSINNSPTLNNKKKESAQATSRVAGNKDTLATTKLDEWDDESFIEEQKKLWAAAQRNKKPSTKALPTLGSNTVSATNGSSAWTTVTKASKVSSTTTKSNSTTTSSILNPDKLRAIGGNNTNKGKQIGSSTVNPNIKVKYPSTITTSGSLSNSSSSSNAYPGNASISTRQDFLKWCKTQMKLNPNVKSTSVLEVLFSLPAGPESKEIIADTIYSNSSVMDGRRFATEFIKRRVECEKQIEDPLSWLEVLQLPEGNVDDWEFQVVNKKKGRRH